MRSFLCTRYSFYYGWHFSSRVSIPTFYDRKATDLQLYQPIRRVHNELAIQLACNTSVLSGLNFNCWNIITSSLLRFPQLVFISYWFLICLKFHFYHLVYIVFFFIQLHLLLDKELNEWLEFQTLVYFVKKKKNQW